MALTESAVRALLAAKIAKLGLRAFCGEHDLDPGHTHRVANGAKLSPAILDALGLEVDQTIRTYRRKR
jgi:hypothetical protein